MTRFLLSNKLKVPGLIIFFSSLIIGLIDLFYAWEPVFLNAKAFNIFGNSGFLDNINNYLDEIISLLLIIGGIMAGFSKEKIEDEYISKLRLESLAWSIYLNYAILFLAIILVSGLDFITVMMANMFTVLIFFVIRFNLVLYIKSRRMNNEK